MDKRMWDSFIKKEELESSPGVINEDLIRALTLNTYLVYIKDALDKGWNIYPEAAADMIENVMDQVFMCQTYIFTGRYPEPDESSAYSALPENVEAREKMTYLTCHATQENWEEIEQQLKDMAGAEAFAALDKIEWDTEERRKTAEKWARRFKENDYIRL